MPSPPPTPRFDVSNPFVRKLEGFGPLRDADRALLERISANAQRIGPRVDLIREGDTPDGVILIMEGIACRQKHRANGARHITAYLVPGDACDLDVALLTQMDHTITTLSTCRVVRLSLDLVKRLMDEHPAIARSLRISTLVDEATLREWLVNVGCRSAIERIAHLLCELLVRLQIVGFASEDSYEFPVTQLDLADTVGLSNVHVNRSLQELRRQGVIELRGRTLKILDHHRLKSIAEFNAKYLHLGTQAAA
ncbi:Crp/Fnr family transcriptional regulator [Methylobacterium sp. J-078]|uniref:Crp/Fnr family transcriptional regulator n=1 Tax=Methylobacterium sp. J-078 TaxID=2836657 RepID=UPI001FB9224B|nr:Crp/Fnr family transcriptional regulator [Methylobacterium sp. J-078]MCJ2044374.1 Crp/Fnr family transcriptional regulator [Methylobacterium sp. J-078]